MNIWLLIWLFIAAVLLYFFGWTLYILFQQKRAWQAFAKKAKLRYKPGRWQESPDMSGNYNGTTISYFTGEHISPDVRGSRKLTAIEVSLSSKMPFEGGVASRGMVEFIKTMGFKEEILPQNPKWKSEYIATSNTPYALQSYLTDTRLEALFSLMRIKNAWVILIFKEDTMLLRLDTPDPLETEKKLEAITKRMVEVAKRLELEQGEAQRLKEDALRTAPRQAEIHITDENIDLNTSGLQLEGEGEVKSKEASPQPKKNKAQKDKSGSE